MTIPKLPADIFKGGGSVGGGTPFTGDKDLGVKIPATPSFSVPTMPAPGAPLSGGGGSSGGGAGGGNLFSPAGGGTVNAFTPFGVAERIAARGDITINVNGGISTGPQIGQAVYNALLNYKQVYGPLDALAV